MKTFKRILILCLFIFVALSGIVYAQNNSDSKEIIISGNFGATGVIIKGFTGNYSLGPDGSYRIIVPSGWSGKIVPEKEGYEFSPPTREYSSVSYDFMNQDYLASVKTFTISGTIVSDKGEPVKGVLIANQNNPVSTDENGRYSIGVEYGWAGTLRPEKEGYVFSPAFIQNPRTTRDKANQNFKAQMRMLTISETLEITDKPIQGVKVTANPGNIETVSDSKGQFSIQVPYGWSGDIVLSKPGIIIDSPAKSYQNVTTDIINGIPVPPANVLPTIMPQFNSFQTQMGRSVNRRILFIPSGDIDSKDIAETKEDILVMAEILDERFREPRLIEGVLRDFGDFFGRDNKQTEAICIQNYGIVFMMEVNYQFSSTSKPEEKVETQTNSDSDTDQTWQQARQRVLSPGTQNNGNRDYEEQMVGILKTELLRTLKYASNIRNIKSDEWVILSVNGSSRSSMPLMGGGSFNTYSSGGSYGGGVIVGGGSGIGGGYSGTYGFSASSGGYGITNNMMTNNQTKSSAAPVMTIRVKKSEVDEFANEIIDLEQFREKVQILLY